MGDINFDQFKQEIRVAENYLRAETSQQYSSDASSSSRLRSSDDGIVLDAERKELILQSFGRRSLASSHDFAARASYRHADDENPQYNRSLFDGVSVSLDPYWKEGGRAITIPSGDKVHDGSQLSARYTEPSEREKLINRLLADHDFNTSSSSIARNASNAASSGLSDGFVEDSNPYTQQKSAHLPSTDSPDSLNSTSDEENTLFYASDLNPLIHVDIERHYGRDTIVDEDGHHRSESADIAIKSYTSDVDALSRMASTGYGLRDLGRDRSSDRERVSLPRDSSNSKLLDLQVALPLRENVIREEDLQEEEGEEDGLSDPSRGRRGPKSAAGPDTGAKYRYDISSKHEIESFAPGSDRVNPKPSRNPITLGTAEPDATQSPARARKYHKSKEQLQIEAEVSFKQQYAFKPTIIATQSDGDNRRESSGRARIEEMQNLYKKSREEREKKKKDYLQSQLVNCTFQPQITKMGCNSSRSKSKTGSQLFDAVDFLSGGTGYTAKAVPDAGCKGGAAVVTAMRLHDEAEQRIAQQRWLEKQVEEARLSQFTFQPAINPAVSSLYSDIDHRPIYERVGELQREKEDRLRNLKQSHEDAQVDLTFTPQIDARSRRIAERRLESEGDDHDSSHSCSRGQTDANGMPWPTAGQNGVGARLHREALLASRRMKQLCLEREEALVSEMAPARPCKGTEKLAQENVIVGASFADRQTMHSLRVQQNGTALQKAADCEGASWFKPDISSQRSANIIASKRPELLSETVDDRAKRMSQEAAEGRERRRKAKEDELYGSMTFVPEIDPLSRAMGRSRGLQELVENKSGQKLKEVARIAADKIEDSKCTFKPSINAYPGTALTSSFSSSRGAERAEESRYNADLTPVGWAECSLVAGQSLSCRTSDAEEEGDGDTDEDSLEPLRQRSSSSPGVLGGLRSRHLDGRHGQYKRCSVNLREPERMSRNIRQQQAEREQKRREELIAREVEEMRECTFQPSLNAHSSSMFSTSQGCTRRSSAHDQQPVVVRGLGRHLELKHLSLRQREEACRRETEVFSVKNIERFRRGEDGSTIVKPFMFSEMSDRSSYSRTASLTASASGLPDRLNSSRSTSAAAYNSHVNNNSRSRNVLQR